MPDSTTDPVGTSTGDSSTGAPPDCTPLMQGFTDPPLPSGWERCGDKLAHRVEAVACAVPTTPAVCDPATQLKNCSTNADCVEFPFGSCQTHPQPLVCDCTYGCQTDADCDAGEVCRCGGPELGPYTTCVPSKCVVDGDCGDEVCQFANAAGDSCPFEVTEGACSTPIDMCENDLPCKGKPCSSYGERGWQCGGGVCGRPLLIDDRAVTAAPVARDDWQARLAVAVAPPTLHAQLAAHWTAVALAEHASVASFARFSLQLLAVGAPPELVLATQQALADEVEHARVGFALASLYSGRGIGPGDLPHAHGMSPCDLDAVLAAVINEACIGETLSALEVREAAVRAEDPALRRTLARIADDEQRHAELGWRFVQWALARVDVDARARAHAVFASAIAAAHSAAHAFADAPGEPELRPHGIIDAPLRAALWREGLSALVRPAVNALKLAA